MDTRLDFHQEWESIACPVCKSPFHEQKDCPQSKIKGESKFKFRTRKELGLTPNSLPFKFQVDIDPQIDDGVEVSRKRALLRLNSSKVYSLMGMSVKAYESQKAVLQWLISMADELDVEDEQLQEERRNLLPIIKSIQDSLHKLDKIRHAKIKQAEAMEEISTEARISSRKVRTRIAKQKAQDKEFWILRLPDSNVDVPIVYGEDPTSLIKEAADAILEKEKSKYIEDEEEDNL